MEPTPTRDSADTPSRDLARLQRWESAGGTWAVLSRRPETVLISLRRCDGGEEADRLSSGERDVLDYIGDHDPDRD